MLDIGVDEVPVPTKGCVWIILLAVVMRVSVLLKILKQAALVASVMDFWFQYLWYLDSKE